MKFSKIALFAILLWGITLIVFLWFFVRGNTVAGTDNRIAVVLSSSERSFVLSEMRGLLVSTYRILDGINRNDLKQVASAARAAGTGFAADANPAMMASDQYEPQCNEASAADVSPALMVKLPLAFKKLGMGLHRDMDDLAQAAEKGASPAELQTRLSDILSKCVACHSGWQIKEES